MLGWNRTASLFCSWWTSNSSVRGRRVCSRKTLHGYVKTIRIFLQQKCRKSVAQSIKQNISFSIKWPEVTFSGFPILEKLFHETLSTFLSAKSLYFRPENLSYLILFLIKLRDQMVNFHISRFYKNQDMVCKFIRKVCNRMFPFLTHSVRPTKF